MKKIHFVDASIVGIPGDRDCGSGPIVISIPDHRDQDSGVIVIIYRDPRNGDHDAPG